MPETSMSLSNNRMAVAGIGKNLLLSFNEDHSIILNDPILNEMNITQHQDVAEIYSGINGGWRFVKNSGISYFTVDLTLSAMSAELVDRQIIPKTAEDMSINELLSIIEKKLKQRK